MGNVLELPGQLRSSWGLPVRAFFCRTSAFAQAAACTCAHVSVARARLRKQQHQKEHVAQNAACAHVCACFRCARVCANSNSKIKNNAQNTACAHVRARFQRSQPLPSTPPSRRLLAAFSPASRRLLAGFSPPSRRLDPLWGLGKSDLFRQNR